MLAECDSTCNNNVHADVQVLARYELVSVATTQVGRRTTVPRVPFSVLEFRIAV